MKKLLVVVMAVMAVVGLMVSPSFGADKLIVKDSGGSNTVFVVQDTGYTGVGTAAPVAKLSVTDQAVTATRGIITSLHADSIAGTLNIYRKSRGTEAAPTIVQSGDYNGAFLFQNAGGGAGNFINNAYIGARVNGTITPSSIPTELYFATSATNENNPFANGKVRLLIGATGNVGVGTTSPSRLFSVGNGGAGSDGSTWFTSSSREYKDNVQELSAEKALEAVKNMTPVTFVYKDIPNYNHVGFIAEDVPNLVATPDRKSLSAMDIVAVLTKVVQEQTKTIEALSVKVDMLEKASTK